MTTLLGISAVIFAGDRARRDDATMDLSIRAALRLMRRVREIEEMTPDQRDYFEGVIPEKVHREEFHCLVCRGEAAGNCLRRSRQGGKTCQEYP